MVKFSKEFSYVFVLSLLFLLFVALFWTEPYLLLVLIIVLSILALLITRSKADFILYFIMLIASFISEAFYVSLGTWKHGTTQVFGVPLWIPFSWGLLSLFVKYFAEEIKRFT